jgi:glycosyltransferase involved in cell wall biosynthesis
MRPDLQGLRLLIVGNWPAPLGGVAVHVRALRDAARKAGAHVTVLDIGEGQNRGEGVFPSGREPQFLANLTRLARANDLVHLHTSGANPKSWILTGLVGVTAEATKCQPIVTFHSGHGPRYLSTSARAMAARLALRPYRRVICVNDEISKTLNHIGAAYGRHVVAPAFGREGVEAGSLPPLAADFVAKHPLIVSAMLAPGRDYGAVEIFGAFARFRAMHPEAGLIVYGPGTEDEATRQLAQPLGGAALRLGQIERPAALAVMRASRLFVRPTLVDGDAVSVREALAMGTRVIATRVGHRPEGVFLCNPGDIEDLARVMKTAVAATPPGRGSEGADGIDTVLQVYGRLGRHRTPLAA